jgi:hypothetical protein
MCSALAGGYGGVMAVNTGIGSLRVIKRCNHWRPHIGGVTGIALFAGEWVCT